MFKSIAQISVEVILIPYLLVWSFVSRYLRKRAQIGLGPDPLINNPNHKKALELYGYTAETFATKSYYITNQFDIVISDRFSIETPLGKFRAFMFLVHLAFRYEILYLYFNGGALSAGTLFIWKLEPLFLKIAGIKTVLMPYGSDVQELSRSSNLYFKHAIASDYPNHKKRRNIIKSKIDLWTLNANHIISGCEWVDYMYHWDTLMLAHFSINVDENLSIFKKSDDDHFTILHAPNHKEIKGSRHLIQAINNLRNKGYNIDLNLLERVPNAEVIKAICDADLVADQFVVGWYAMFAIEAMMLSKPVLCYLRDDLESLYVKAGIIEFGEIPIINTSVEELEDKIIWAYDNKNKLKEIGNKSREYVVKHHSLKAIGKTFDQINKSLMVKK